MSDVEKASSEDKSQIGVTPAGREILERLKGEYFASEKAAFQASIALALELGLEPSAEVGFETKWGLGTMSGVLEFLAWYLPTETPARAAERLGDAGLRYVESGIETGKTVSEIFARDPKNNADAG